MNAAGQCKGGKRGPACDKAVRLVEGAHARACRRCFSGALLPTGLITCMLTSKHVWRLCGHVKHAPTCTFLVSPRVSSCSCKLAALALPVQLVVWGSLLQSTFPAAAS